MAVNLPAIVIVLVIFAAAIIALFVLQHKKSVDVKSHVKSLKGQVSNLQAQIGNMSSNITTDEITIGPWSITHYDASTSADDELQFCARGVTRMFLKNSTVPKPANGKNFQTLLYVPSKTFVTPLGRTMENCAAFT